MSTALAKLRKLVRALPDSHEVEAWGEPTFRINNKLFAMYASGGTHHAEVASVWIKATPVNQGFIIASNPKQYFKPPYVGPSGWVGVKLEGRVNWTVIADLLRDAYDLTVVKKKRPKKPLIETKSQPQRPRRNAQPRSPKARGRI